MSLALHAYSEGEESDLVRLLAVHTDQTPREALVLWMQIRGWIPEPVSRWTWSRSIGYTDTRILFPDGVYYHEYPLHSLI